MFYVYQLRIRGEDLSFYIGKGKGNRAWCHLDVRPSDRSFKTRKIRKAQLEGKEIIVELIKTDLSEDDAFFWEVFFISEYGRKDLGLGPLTNLTDGGEGQSGANVSIETRQKRSNSLKNRWSSMPHYMQGRKHTEDHKRKIGESSAGRTHSIETKLTLSVLMKTNTNGLGKRKIVVCPHCGKSGGVNAMNRWHFDKCKLLI